MVAAIGLDKATLMKNTNRLAILVIVGSLATQSFGWPNAERALATPSTTATCAVALPSASGPQAIALLQQHKLYDSLAAAYEAARYRAEPIGRVPAPVKSATLYAPNPAKGFDTYFAGDAIHIRPNRAGEPPVRWSRATHRLRPQPRAATTRAGQASRSGQPVRIPARLAYRMV